MGRNGLTCVVSAVLGVPILFSQGVPELTPRQLFYWDGTAALPERRTPKQTHRKVSKGPPGGTPVKSSPPAGTNVTSGTEPRPSPVAQEPLFVPTANKLAVRYNVLKVNPQNGDTREVDTDTVFLSGDCAAVRFTPNLSGFVYVLSQGSTGKWSVLLPSREAPNEKRSVSANVPRTIPEEMCFEFDDKPGRERLLIVLTNEEPERLRLDREFLASSGMVTAKANASIGPRSPDTPLVSANIQRIASQLVSRDVSLQKIRRPSSSDEPPHSVYAADLSPTPSQSLTIEVVFRHE